MPSKITHETDFYPTLDNFKNTENEFVTLALQTFIRTCKITSEAELFITSYFFCIQLCPCYLDLLLLQTTECHQNGLTMFYISVGSQLVMTRYVKSGCH